MRKGILLTFVLILSFINSEAKECGGKGYTGTDKSYCLSCHRSGCPIVHPVDIEIRKTECIDVPENFPRAEDNRMTCTTCHDMTSNRKKFLRGKGEFKERYSFCFQCHNRECYKKFNPHRTISSKLSWNEKKKACIYCHGFGAKLNAYRACVGCHTKTPHVGAPEHLFAKREEVLKLTEGKKEIVNVSTMKQLNPKIDINELKKRKPKVILVNGRIECITCHNPHPQIAIPAPPERNPWGSMERADFEYKVKKLNEELSKFEVNTNGVKLMSRGLRSGKLCKVCHSINSLK
jgi:excinuclease UvrABC ATPase subunit